MTYNLNPNYTGTTMNFASTVDFRQINPLEISIESMAEGQVPQVLTPESDTIPNIPRLIILSNKPVDVVLQGVSACDFMFTVTLSVPHDCDINDPESIFFYEKGAEFSGTLWSKVFGNQLGAYTKVKLDFEALQDGALLDIVDALWDSVLMSNAVTLTKAIIGDAKSIH